MKIHILVILKVEGTVIYTLGFTAKTYLFELNVNSKKSLKKLNQTYIQILILQIKREMRIVITPNPTALFRR